MWGGGGTNRIHYSDKYNDDEWEYRYVKAFSYHPKGMMLSTCQTPSAIFNSKTFDHLSLFETKSNPSLFFFDDRDLGM